MPTFHRIPATRSYALLHIVESHPSLLLSNDLPRDGMVGRSAACKQISKRIMTGLNGLLNLEVTWWPPFY